MAVCQSGHQMSQGTTFCTICGARSVTETSQNAPQGPSQATACGKCGAALAPGSVFCMSCGQPATAASTWVMSGSTGATMQSFRGSTVSPLLSVAILVGSVLMFLMLGFVGLILGQYAFHLGVFQGHSWTWNYRGLSFWQLFHHTGIPERVLGLWRDRIFVLVSFSTLILSLVMVSSRTVRQSVGIWISLLVAMSLAFLGSLAVIIQSSVISTGSSIAGVHGVTGPSILAAFLSLLLLGVSIVGVIQARRARSRLR